MEVTQEPGVDGYVAQIPSYARNVRLPVLNVTDVSVFAFKTRAYACA